ncbi:MAG: hypothetical protein ACTSPG_00095 [Candidatus Hodarchaeales archaeon]
MTKMINLTFLFIRQFQQCFLRNMPEIRKSNVLIVGESFYPTFLPFTVPEKSNSDLTPCGLQCNSCLKYKQKICVGCPSSKDYKGMFAIEG